MAILVDESTRVLVQGITGSEGRFHTKVMLDYGTKVVAGVTPGKGGEKVYGVPVYNFVEEAVEEHPEINSSIVFVPAKFAADAVFEAIEAKLNPIVVITEHIPVSDSLEFVNYARMKGIKIIGPNCPGAISPGKTKVGILPAKLFTKGGVGIVSRSGTLTYEIADAITKAKLGQSTCVGIGGDPIIGLDFIEVIKMFEKDPETKGVVIIGEIGGDMEEKLAEYITKKGVTKPVVAYIAGRTAPPGKRMGHAGAIVAMGKGSAESKLEALKEAGVPVAEIPSQIAELMKRTLTQ